MTLISRNRTFYLECKKKWSQPSIQLWSVSICSSHVLHCCCSHPCSLLIQLQLPPPDCWECSAVICLCVFLVTWISVKGQKLKNESQNTADASECLLSVPAPGSGISSRLVSKLFFGPALSSFMQCLTLGCFTVSQLSVILLQLAHLALEPEVHFPLRLEVTQQIITQHLFSDCCSLVVNIH